MSRPTKTNVRAIILLVGFFRTSFVSKHRSPDGSNKGSQTRQNVLDHAMGIAALEGLGRLSFGRLAEELRMSKSGLFVHFGSKEQLEIAIVEQAGDIFSRHVLLPSRMNLPEGIERVWSLCDSWLEFAEQNVLPGGYFFSGSFFECARQRGPVPTAITAIVRDWFKALRQAIHDAQKSGDIDGEVDNKKLAFGLNGILLGAQWSHLLANRDYGEARVAILQKLGSVTIDKIPHTAFESVRAWRKYLANRSA